MIFVKISQLELDFRERLSHFIDLQLDQTGGNFLDSANKVVSNTSIDYVAPDSVRCGFQPDYVFNAFIFISFLGGNF